MKRRIYIKALIIICVVIVMNIINLSGESFLNKLFSNHRTSERRATININEDDKIMGMLNRFEQGLIERDVSMIIEYCTKSIKIDNKIISKKQFKETLDKTIKEKKINLTYMEAKCNLISKLNDKRLYLIKYGDRSIKVIVKKKNGVYRIYEINGIYNLYGKQNISIYEKRKRKI